MEEVTAPGTLSNPIIVEEERKKRARTEDITRWADDHAPREEILTHLFGVKLCELVREATELNISKTTSAAAMHGIWFDLLRHKEEKDIVHSSAPWEYSELAMSIHALYVHIYGVSRLMKAYMSIEEEKAKDKKEAK